MASPDVGELLDNLREDVWRRKHPFEEATKTVAGVLLHPFARDEERRKALSRWSQAYQSCLFGRIAAAQDRIHYCFLTESDLRRSDDHVARKINDERRLWKQHHLMGLALGTALSLSRPPTGYNMQFQMGRWKHWPEGFVS
jgi:hypothetical protein